MIQPDEDEYSSSDELPDDVLEDEERHRREEGGQRQPQAIIDRAPPPTVQQIPQVQQEAVGGFQRPSLGNGFGEFVAQIESLYRFPPFHFGEGSSHPAAFQRSEVETWMQTLPAQSPFVPNQMFPWPTQYLPAQQIHQLADQLEVGRNQQASRLNPEEALAQPVVSQQREEEAERQDRSDDSPESAQLRRSSRKRPAVNYS